ncbi:unnamed protein product [Eruca vesicaria subsp. sativa]|uniref:Inosine/uridine-preferring nucleoside hydrolase domain-containing protein n=1 Tax=Eruca vesicaria subsp. sativa TaxID=29727 RepID=A0ABC8JI19_ERUVS|nr:unnamed protein product [Eruca vesicaria subsp. sativa]
MIVIFGGAFFALGNINPSPELSIYGDPKTADVRYMSGADITVVGINISSQFKLTCE